ncbi:MAG: asparaginase, partial [Candidatus Marinimicrobia bacterium]|nr:asparaginase [Candidatus Neomarinimicrobiota bacterium]
SASAVLVGPRGEILAEYGDGQMCAYIRSAAKPFQIIPALESGIQSKFGLSDDEIAVCCSSHSGENIHIVRVQSVLQKTGIDSSLLRCGIHPPLGAEVRRLMRESGESPKLLHNNCSGKHSAMLATAKIRGESLEDYLNPAHPAQQRILEVIKQYSEEEDIHVGVDGCSAPVYYLQLKSIARMYQKLALANDDTVAGDIWQKMTSNPLMIAGSGRYDSVIMEDGKGTVLSKMGAEGVQCMSFKTPDGPIGLAVKVHDGSRRAVVPAVLHLLSKFGLTPDGNYDKFRKPELENHTGIVVGRIEVNG